MSRAKDLSGLNYGRLLVIKRVGTNITPNGSKKPIWECKCLCGKYCVIEGQSLREGTTVSCGCYQKEITSKRGIHWARGTPEHNSWRGMKGRCTYLTNTHYASYGGRGIKFCDRWKDFNNFLEDMGIRPMGTTLDRIDTNGNYEPSNCKWSTIDEQNRNTTRSVIITFNNITKNQCDWAKDLGITDKALEYRLKKFPLEKAMTKGKLYKISKDTNQISFS